MAAAEITYLRLKGRHDVPTGTLAPEFALQGNRAISKVAAGELFPVLVESLPADLRAEYDAWKKAQAETPAPEAVVADVADEAPAAEPAPVKSTRSKAAPKN
jgi:hypothetical protein